MITVALRRRPIHAIYGQRGHTRTNCQQIRAGGENFPQMFPGNPNISKWLKLRHWGNFFGWRTFCMKLWLWCLRTKQQFWVYEPRKCTKRSLNTIKLVWRLEDVIYLIPRPEMNLPQRVTVTSAVVGTMDETDYRSLKKQPKNPKRNDRKGVPVLSLRLFSGP